MQVRIHSCRVVIGTRYAMHLTPFAHISLLQFLKAFGLVVFLLDTAVVVLHFRLAIGFLLLFFVDGVVKNRI